MWLEERRMRSPTLKETSRRDLFAWCSCVALARVRASVAILVLLRMVSRKSAAAGIMSGMAVRVEYGLWGLQPWQVRKGVILVEALGALLQANSAAES